MEPTDKTGTRTEIPEGNLISNASLGRLACLNPEEWA
jgi:hypothetical protein